MKIALIILAVLAVVIVTVGYACCVAAGRADDAARREMRRLGLRDGEDER